MVEDGKTGGRADGQARRISLRLWRGIITSKHCDSRLYPAANPDVIIYVTLSFRFNAQIGDKTAEVY